MCIRSTDITGTGISGPYIYITTYMYHINSAMRILSTHIQPTQKIPDGYEMSGEHTMYTVHLPSYPLAL